MKLFCFHYAGGSAQIYFPWKKKLSPEIDVCAIQLPGRWDRMRETPYTRMKDLIDGVYEIVKKETEAVTSQYAFFGHSFGALVAFELYRKIRKQGHMLPQHLFLSARWAPHFRKPGSPILHMLSDQEFIDVVAGRYSAIPKEILDEPEIRDIFLRVLRADFEVLETYEFSPDEKIKTPMTILGGAKDTEILPEELKFWEEMSCGDFKIKLFDGDHFYLKSCEDELLKMIREELKIM